MRQDLTTLDQALLEPSTLRRRSLLKQGAALAMSAPAGIAGLAALLPAVAHASSTYNSPTEITGYSGTVSDNGTTYQRKVYKTAGGEILVFHKPQNIFIHEWGIVRRHVVSGVTKMSYYNGASVTFPTSSSNTLTVTYPTAAQSINDSWFGNVDGGRRLVDFGLPAGAVIVENYNVNNDSSESTIFAVKYTYQGLTYVRATVLDAANGVWNWTATFQFTGTRYSDFMTKLAAYLTALHKYKSTHGLSWATKVGVATAVVVGVTGAALSFGASLTLAGSVIAGATAANLSASTAAIADAAAVQIAWNALLLFIESSTGNDVVR